MANQFPVLRPEPTDPFYPQAPSTVTEAYWNGRQVTRPWWGLGDLWIALFLWFFFSAIAGTLLVGLSGSSTGKAVGIVITMVLPWIGTAGWPLFAAKLKGNGPRIDLGLRLTLDDFLWGLAFGVLSILVAAVLGAITQIFVGDFSSSAGDLAESMAGNAWALVLFSLGVGIAAPIVEEICFRGLAFNSLAKRGLGPVLTVLGSALIFGLIHLEPVRIVMLTGVGIVLGVARLKTGSAGAPIIAHMVNNLPGAIGILLLIN